MYQMVLIVESFKIDHLNPAKVIYYTEKFQRKIKADQWLKDRSISVKEIGFIWIQGGADKGQTKAYYRGQLDKLVRDRRHDGFIMNYTMLVITQIPNSSIGYGSGVYQAKLEFITANNTAVSIEYPELYNSDNIHLNTKGQMDLGIACGTKVIFLMILCILIYKLRNIGIKFLYKWIFLIL